MGLFSRVARSPFLIRRVLVELRGIRVALERQADVMELQAQLTPSKGGQGFRGFSRDKHADLPGAGDSSVSYVDQAEMALAESKRDELVGLLGRDPDAEELARAMRGDIE